MFCEDAPPGICFAARARHALAAPSFHHRLAIGLLIEADPYHVHAHIEAEYRTREGERGAPLPGTGLRGKSLDASVLIVKGLGYSGVVFVAARRTHPFIFVVDLGRSIERPLESACPIKWRGPPLTVD